jgi:hypothetical protein
MEDPMPTPNLPPTSASPVETDTDRLRFVLGGVLMGLSITSVRRNLEIPEEEVELHGSVSRGLLEFAHEELGWNSDDLDDAIRRADDADRPALVASLVLHRLSQLRPDGRLALRGSGFEQYQFADAGDLLRWLLSGDAR